MLDAVSHGGRAQRGLCISRDSLYVVSCVSGCPVRVRRSRGVRLEVFRLPHRLLLYVLNPKKTANELHKPHTSVSFHIPFTFSYPPRLSFLLDVPGQPLPTAKLPLHPLLNRLMQASTMPITGLSCGKKNMVRVPLAPPNNQHMDEGHHRLPEPHNNDRAHETSMRSASRRRQHCATGVMSAAPGNKQAKHTSASAMTARPQTPPTDQRQRQRHPQLRGRGGRAGVGDPQTPRRAPKVPCPDTLSHTNTQMPTRILSTHTHAHTHAYTTGRTCSSWAASSSCSGRVPPSWCPKPSRRYRDQE